MRAKLIGLLLGGALVAATSTAAMACQYNNLTMASDKSEPAQTAQADPAPPATAPDKN